MAKFLPGHHVDELLLELRGWHRRGPSLEKIYPAASHADALALLSQVAELLSGAGHEPALDARTVERTVYLGIHTPAHGGITDADLELARRIDQLARPHLRPVGPGQIYGDPSEEAPGVIGRGRPIGESVTEAADVIGRGRPMGDPAQERAGIIGRGRPYDPGHPTDAT
jgi:4a-hydroxytetrahydrobiopterin dehydratase